MFVHSDLRVTSASVAIRWIVWTHHELPGRLFIGFLISRIRQLEFAGGEIGVSQSEIIEGVVLGSANQLPGGDEASDDVLHGGAHDFQIAATRLRKLEDRDGQSLRE